MLAIVGVSCMDETCLATGETCCIALDCLHDILSHDVQ